LVGVPAFGLVEVGSDSAENITLVKPDHAAATPSRCKLTVPLLV
jgi:hypothetical protein